MNADGYVSTGQGVVSQNMFAYCLNNPVNYADLTGNFPGEIHNQVVKRIAYFYGYYSEQTIIYKTTGYSRSERKGAYGRADLISPTGQVWDVKRGKLHHITAGENQVKKYTTGKWNGHENVKLTVGGDEISTGFFYYQIGLTQYKVTYWNAGRGVIAYDYTPTEFKYETAKSLADAVGVGVVAAAAYETAKAIAAMVLGWIAVFI